MKFIVTFIEKGEHTHVRIWGGLHPGFCGDVVFRNDEWKELKERVLDQHRDIIEVNERTF